MLEIKLNFSLLSLSSLQTLTHLHLYRPLTVPQQLDHTISCIGQFGQSFNLIFSAGCIYHEQFYFYQERPFTSFEICFVLFPSFHFCLSNSWLCVTKLDWMFDKNTKWLWKAILRSDKAKRLRKLQYEKGQDVDEERSQRAVHIFGHKIQRNFKR